MACTRGCAGTPLCSALDLCCMQLRQDCGKGCAGVAVGYSVLQINAAGLLEICSNVGGVCTCEEVAANVSDSLVNDGNGQYTHTDVDGNPVVICVGEAVAESIGASVAGGNVLQLDTDCDGVADIDICEGFCSILSDNDCVQGVGADYVVQEFSIANDVLTINSIPKPEHLVVQVEPNFIQQAIPVSVPTGVTIGLELTDTDVINPSDCLDMDVCIRARMWGAMQNFETTPGYIMTHDFTLTVDFGIGPEFAHVISAQNRLPPPALDWGHSNNDGEIEWCFVLPAGATQNVVFQAEYNCTDGPCFAADYFGLGYVIEGHTQQV